MQKRVPVTIWILVGLLSGALWIFRPYTSYNKAKVHPSIASLVQPFKTIATAYWMDGGSLSILLVDSRGIEFVACLPEPDYRRLFIGASHYCDAGAVEIPDPQDSIACLLDMIRSGGHHSHANDSAVALASGRLRDWLTLGWRTTTKRYRFLPTPPS
jgi:hypothetical protein